MTNLGLVIVCNAKRTHTESEPRKETLQLVSNFIKWRSARLASKASDRIIHEGVLSIIVTSGNARLLHFGGLSCYILLLLWNFDWIKVHLRQTRMDPLHEKSSATHICTWAKCDRTCCCTACTGWWAKVGQLLSHTSDSGNPNQPTVMPCKNLCANQWYLWYVCFFGWVKTWVSAVEGVGMHQCVTWGEVVLG